MTAEIAILNKSAVALAADSKVTVSSGGQEKTYDTVNKLFTLSRVHPVGVMIYGNADFMGFPWETIIKEYRKSKGTLSESKIADWGSDFLEFLSQFFDYQPADCKANISSIARSQLSDLMDDVRDEMIVGDTNEIFENVLSNEINKRLEEAAAAAPFLSDDETKSFRDSYMPVLTETAARVPETDGIRERFCEFLVTSITRNHYSPLQSGIVIAGFGEDQKLPAIVAYDTDGFIFPNKLKSRPQADSSLNRKHDAIIIPFAQRDMVIRFMEGIDARYRSFLEGSVKKLIVSNAVSVLEGFATGLDDMEAAKAAVTELAVRQFDEFSDTSAAYRKEYYSSPIIDMVGTLPKEELANMAEALVNLTSLKRRVSLDRETVGGPVDVAVISKGDGFIWIKRKHYFDPKLNHHFTANYFRDIGEKEDDDE